MRIAYITENAKAKLTPLGVVLGEAKITHLFRPIMKGDQGVMLDFECGKFQDGTGSENGGWVLVEIDPMCNTLTFCQADISKDGEVLLGMDYYSDRMEKHGKEFLVLDAGVFHGLRCVSPKKFKRVGSNYEA